MHYFSMYSQSATIANWSKFYFPIVLRPELGLAALVYAWCRSELWLSGDLSVVQWWFHGIYHMMYFAKWVNITNTTPIIFGFLWRRYIYIYIYISKYMGRSPTSLGGHHRKSGYPAHHLSHPIASTLMQPRWKLEWLIHMFYMFQTGKNMWPFSPMAELCRVELP